MSARDFISLLGLTLAGSVGAAIVGAALLRRIRLRAIRTQAVAIAAAALLSALAGVFVVARAMFISSHDFRVLLIVLALSAAVGLGAAAQFGTELDRNTETVRDLARRLGAGAQVDDRPPVAAEFEAIADEVVDLPKRLDELRRRAEALEQSRRNLVAWVSHDLRSPLATIRAMAEALDDRVVTDAPTTAAYHHQIRRDAERLSALVDDLFELSRIHSGVREIRRDVVSLQSVVGDAVASQVERAEQLGVRLIDEVREPVVIEVAVAELTRVLHNMLDNAIRHTPSGGNVIVRAHALNGQAVVSVEDQCGGIPAPDLDRVFDVAFRGDAARGKGDQGGGLGLAIAKGLVEACAGDIAVDNVHAGCRFTVTLPLPA